MDISIGMVACRVIDGTVKIHMIINYYVLAIHHISHTNENPYEANS